MRDGVIAIILLLIMILNFFDVLTDISLGVPLWHIFSESLIVVVSAIGALFLIRDMKIRTSNIVNLKKELNLSDDKLRNISDEMKNARHEYSAIIQNQFDRWALTSSEQEVAMLLLKGLSFKEMSAVRNTKEKTIRQQASTIYSKANVEGRHEFAAWFFEDFIQD
ncbi:MULTISPECIES: LuxR C-terminal-related transcriptional regulator [Thalassotalea]|uniref:LuxR C-terminal-related transcriptional regulator n=1 Tax=Thalassotalea castellviae TaxID=3075612 RepID=A0ABU2ZYC8_9GAMM|nr:LuxR C-terminal-related transcriptional regulator [Thalassotalea sp. W431]MDT0602327.1 LuxR C-terminal-related transcriptional regulator [Thalassotalea sp. W431]